MCTLHVYCVKEDRIGFSLVNSVGSKCFLERSSRFNFVDYGIMGRHSRSNLDRSVLALGKGL